MARKLMMATLVIIAAVAVMFVFAYNSILVEEVKLHQAWINGYKAYLNDSEDFDTMLASVPDSIANESGILIDLATDHRALLDLKPSEIQDDFLGAMKFLSKVNMVRKDIEDLLVLHANDRVYPFTAEEITSFTKMSLRLQKIAYDMELQIAARDEALESFSGTLVGSFMGKMTSSYYHQFVLSEHTI